MKAQNILGSFLAIVFASATCFAQENGLSEARVDFNWATEDSFPRLGPPFYFYLVSPRFLFREK